ncbi:MAG: dihydroorotate dehydrogenase-like protein [Phycisphaerae bacterium]|jgi:dihydroorotate dehydrogenase (fumarate)
MELSTTYLGLKLKSPIVPAAGPLATDIGAIRDMEEAGAGAVVLHSLFEEQLEHEAAEMAHHLEHGAESFAEANSYFPQPYEFRLGPEEYLEHIRMAREAVSIPIIASLNGVTAGGWTRYARLMQQAGASAIELNVYYVAADAELTADAVEQRYLNVLAAVKSAVTIPVAMKISPYFTALAGFARRLDRAGANGLVLFNRFYQPDIDLDTLDVAPNLILSSSWEMRLPLRWIAILWGRIQADLAATSGVSNALDAIKLVMAGASVTQVCSVLLRKGIYEISTMLDDMQRWMEERGYESLEQMRGSMSRKSIADPGAFERANYMKTLNSYV